MAGGRISGAEARRIALAAQGFAQPRPTGRRDRRHLERVLDRVGVIQIDSVNVLARAHYMPMFSRLGPYPPALLDQAAGPRQRLFEYWAHEASLLPVEDHSLVRWRMERMAAESWSQIVRMGRDQPDFVQAIYDKVAAAGPLAASDLAEPGERQGSWWGWGDTKVALEWLHRTGRLAAGRKPSFERVYGRPELFIPAEHLAVPAVPELEARRALLQKAARSLGVATASDLADYHRQRGPMVKALIQQLVAEGALIAVEVDGWGQTAYLHPEAARPRRVSARALVSPFDPLVWNRARTSRLFGFDYRIEIYVPAAKRQYGYYVLPFLWGDTLVARVDLKADRARSRLQVLSAHGEAGIESRAVARALAVELAELASWLGLTSIEVAPVGDLSGALRMAA